MAWTPPTLQKPLPALLASTRVTTSFEDAGRGLLSALLGEASAATDAEGARLLRVVLCTHGPRGYRAVISQSADDDPTPGQVGLPSSTAWRWVRERRAPFLLNLGLGVIQPADGGEGVPLEGAARVGDSTLDLLSAGDATHIYGIPLRRDDGPINAIATLEFSAPGRLGEPLRLWRRLAPALTLLADVLAPLVLARPHATSDSTPGSSTLASAWLPVVGAEMSSRLSILDRIGPTASRILLLGPTGVGKSQLARRIHERSPRARGPFVTAVLPEFERDRVGAELFGWRKGAFSNAMKDHAGFAGDANGGTLFLDEVGELGLDVQVKLLRFLDEGRYRPLAHAGADLRADVRVIAATNRDLEQMVRDGTFRADLMYRLNQVRLELPGLDERIDEIPGWSRHFLARAHAGAGRAGEARLTPGAEALLARTPWPGNLRDLASAVELAYVYADPTASGVTVDETHVAQALHLSGGARPIASDRPSDAVRQAAERWLDALEGGTWPAEALAWRHSRTLLRSALLVAAKQRYGLSDGLRRLGEELRVRQNNHSRALVEAEADLAHFEARLRGELVASDEPRQGS